MNIYEDEQLEIKLNELTDQMGHLILDMLLVSFGKLRHENMIFKDFEDSRKPPKEEDPF